MAMNFKEWRKWLGQKIDAANAKEAEPVKPAALACDPESKKLWQDLQESIELKICCKVILHGFKGNMTHIEYSFKKPLDGVSGFDIQIRHCPHCGRKLK